MRFEIRNNLVIHEPTQEIHKLCQKHLIVDNPEYVKKERMGLWTGSTPPKLCFYEADADRLILPTGCTRGMHRRFPDARWEDYRVKGESFSYGSEIALYGYQEEAVKAALDVGGGIIVSICGSGKTVMGLELVARLGVKTLWLTHTADLLNQSMARAKSVFSCDTDYGKITEGKVQVGAGLTFATVQTMAKLDMAKHRDTWGCIIVDECFPGCTFIDTPSGKKKLQNLRNGDIVTSFNRSNGKLESKRVLHVFKNQAHDIVNVKLSNGEEIICTRNHPFFTKRGQWISAERLENDDYVLRLVREGSGNGRNARYIQAQSVGKRILFLFKSMFGKRRTQEAMDGRTQEKSCGNDGCHKSKICKRTHDKEQSDEKSRNSRMCIKAIKRDWTSSSDQMREWHGANCTTTSSVDFSCRQRPECLCRISNSNKNGKKFWLSDLLQGRYCDSKYDDGDRDRWKFALFGGAAKTRQQENCFFNWVRVASVEVQEQTSNGTFGGLCPDGYVYNIEVEDNNNYFANGVLVHNCHHCVGGPTKVAQFYKVLSNLAARHKYGLTATPKRADGMETAMFALLGGICHEVPREAVKDTTCPVKVRFVETGWMPSDVAFLGDGTISYNGLVEDLTTDKGRMGLVAKTVLGMPKGEPVMVLGSRVAYLEELSRLVSASGRRCRCISGMSKSKAAKIARKDALAALGRGEIDCLLATYQLAKEGLDCPNLKHVVFATPEKDPTTIQQAAGRVGRKAEGKEYGTVWDFADAFGMYQGWAKKRKAVYKKLGYEIE